MDDQAWPEHVEIHFQMIPSIGALGASAALEPLETVMDQLLEGLGSLEGNEIGEDEWVTYVDCMDANAVVEKLKPKLRDLRDVGSIYVIKKTRVAIR